ncbi:hypothetical protein AtEden1_Chr2g0230051 [Arabidopsis thaliana]
MDSLLWIPKNCLLILLSVCKDLHLQNLMDMELWFLYKPRLIESPVIMDMIYRMYMDQ